MNRESSNIIYVLIVAVVASLALVGLIGNSITPEQNYNVPQIPEADFEIYTGSGELVYVVNQGYELELWVENVGLVHTCKTAEEVLQYLQENSLTSFSGPSEPSFYEVYVAYDIFYLESHPDYPNWYSIHSEKFGELVQGCDHATALRFLHDNSYRDVTDRYDYNYNSLNK